MSSVGDFDIAVFSSAELSVVENARFYFKLKFIQCVYNY